MLTNRQPSHVPTFKLGLLGYPVSHSLSPRIHTAALQACGLEGEYSLFSIAPEDHLSLEHLVFRLRSGEIQGLNVTIPHKQNVIPFLDELTPTARTIGAVNTIYLRNKKLIGENTDAQGFLLDLQRFFTTHLPDLSSESRAVPAETRKRGGSNALVLGSGGSARAVVYALVKDGWQVTVAARRPEQGQQLAASFESVNTTGFDLQTFQPSDLQLIVNTTPVGMTPDMDQSPWPEGLPFPPQVAIYDLVYNPGETRLVREARQYGLSATTGLGMLIEQAALSFEIWTGRSPSKELMFGSIQKSPVSNY